VRRFQDGNPVAFEQLVRIFAGPVFNLAYRMVSNRSDAEDLSQEIFVKLHRSIDKFRWRSGFRTWLYALAANTCRSGLRRRQRVSRLEVSGLHWDNRDDEPAARKEPADGRDGPDRQVQRAELRREVERAIAELPEPFRMVIVLRDLQGLAYEEIAGALNCAVGTVKSRLLRARLRVKDRLIERGL
jgi:RNA polymerase sigma-70 factor (ECF subfamily)